MWSYLEGRREAIGRVFKRDDLRGLWPEELDAGLAELAGRCFMEQVGAGRVAVGHDARLGSPELAEAFCRGLEAAGGTVRWLGLCSSEQVYFMAGRHADELVAGAMVTASHNPAEYNGIKLVHRGALPFMGEELQELRRRMEAACELRAGEDCQEEFAQFLLSLVPLPPASVGQRPLRVVVAAGNGVGAQAFRPLGERLAAAGLEFHYLDAIPDGRFPHGVPNPLLPEYNERLGAEVRWLQADLGIGFDGDADRAGFVDGDGLPVQASQILAMVALDRLERRDAPADGRRPVILRNLCSSHLLDELFGGRDDVELVETPVGHGQIKRLMRHTAFAGRVLAAGEHSGHYFYPEFYSVDSGMLTALTMLRHLLALSRRGRTLADELSAWRRRFLWSGERNYRLPDAAHVRQALARMRRFAEGEPGRQLLAVRPCAALDGLPLVAEDDGGATLAPDVKVRVASPDGGGWWLVLRPSGNEPVLRLNVEVWDGTRERLETLVAAAERVIRDEE